MKSLAIFGRSREPVTYEVRLEVEPAGIDEFDDWLLEHVREMLAFPGFQAADVYRGNDLTDEGRVVRVAVYRVRSRRELDSYLRTHAARMRNEGVKRFGRQFAASRRILATADYALPDELSVLYDDEGISGGLPICGNCHRPVPGRFCTHCGQEDRTYLLSLAELVGEFFGEMTNFDSRFFRSMRPLLFRPGWLTLEYVRGRRQAYFPPIRMYIIISLLFFFFTALLADSELADAAIDDDATVAGTEAATPEERRKAIEELEDMLETAEGFERRALEITLTELRRQEGIAAPEAKTGEAETGETTGSDAQEPATEGDRDEETDSSGFTVPEIRLDDGEATATGWGSEELNERMERGIEAMQENPEAFVKTMIDNIPSMMFVFLPLVALTLKMLYPFSRRYYVEHLMFALHFHSAVFMLLLGWLLFDELAAAWAALQWLTGWVTAAVWIYIPVYLYKSMRRVYGQGHILTSLKFFMLMISYIFALSITGVLLFIAAVYQQT